MRKMRTDGLGQWNEETIADRFVQWRRRKARADDARFGTDFVVDVSLDGKAPRVYADFDDKVDHDQQLDLLVKSSSEK